MSKTLCELQQGWDLPEPIVHSCEKKGASLTIVMSIFKEYRAGRDTLYRCACTQIFWSANLKGHVRTENAMPVQTNDPLAPVCDIHIMLVYITVSK